MQSYRQRVRGILVKRARAKVRSAGGGVGSRYKIA